jgi:hypothetical protein
MVTDIEDTAAPAAELPAPKAVAYTTVSGAVSPNATSLTTATRCALDC